MLEDLAQSARTQSCCAAAFTLRLGKGAQLATICNATCTPGTPCDTEADDCAQLSILQLPLCVMALGVYMKVTHCAPMAHTTAYHQAASSSQAFCSAPIVFAAIILLVEVSAALQIHLNDAFRPAVQFCCLLNISHGHTCSSCNMRSTEQFSGLLLSSEVKMVGCHSAGDYLSDGALYQPDL